MTALIDGDTLVFKIAITHQEDVDWEDGEPPVTSFDLNLAIRTLRKYLDEILTKVKCTEYEMYLTGSNNFRHSLGSYKENRKSKELPIGLDELKEYARDYLGATIVDGIEADDIVVYLKTKYPKKYIVCAVDKDILYQCEGKHYNYNTEKTIRTSKEDAEKYLYYQVLTGDSTDGYGGCYNIGKVKAEKLLSNTTDYESIVAKEYKKAKHTYEYMLSQYRMASMHQYNGTEIILHELKITEKEYDELKS